MRASLRRSLLGRLASAVQPYYGRRPILPSLFLRLSHGDTVRAAATSAAQPTPCSSPRVAVSEEDLVDMLVQGSSRPRAAAAGVTAAEAAQEQGAVTATAGYACGETCHPATAVASPSTENSSTGAVCSGKTQAGALCDDAATVQPITASRARHREYEPFYRLRRAVQERPGAAVEAGAAAWMVESTMLEWMCCQCQSFNYVTRTTCRRCGATQADAHRDKFPPSRQVVTFPAVWFCEECGNENRPDNGSRAENRANNSNYKNIATSVLLPSLLTTSAASQTRLKFFCQRCGAAFRGMREWFCPYCNHVNSLASVQCATCFTDRPANWACVLCGYTGNSVFRTTCLQCHRARPRAWSDSTLPCPSCGQRNDVRWELCAICMAPLPEMRHLAGLGEQDTARVRLEATTQNASPVAQAQADEAKKATVVVATVAAAGEEETDKSDGQISTAEAVATTTMPAAGGATVRSEATVESDGTWWCHHCNVMHRRNVTFCDICLRPRMLVAEEGVAREAAAASRVSWRESREPRSGAVSEGMHGSQPASTMTATPLSPVVAAKPGEWQCAYCRRFNPVTARSCCGKPREVPMGYWLCPQCCSTNHARRRRCLGCGAAPRPQPWSCPTCDAENGADNLLCVTCATPHPQLWRCAHCGAAVHQLETRCSQCGAAKPTPPAPVRCAVCGAPNSAARRACFRCRARLDHDAWQCRHCQATCPDRVALRCPHCHRPREFDMTQETWICELCGTNTLSGGALAVRTQCPRCGVERSPHCLSFPTRWRCERCGIAVQTKEPRCVECGAPRRVLGLHCSNVTCPTCLHETPLEVSERCGHCGASLSELLTRATDNVTGVPVAGAAEGAAQHTHSHGGDAPAAQWGQLRRPSPSDELDQVCVGVALAEDEEADDGMAGGDGVPDSAEGGDTDDTVAADAAEEVGSVASWVCPTCSTVNREEDEVCVLCTLPRVEDGD